jgi:peptidoglycan/xylan/chitin deacetylase (PgdA/CDA1 family)
MYHRVSETGAKREMLCIPPGEFAAQMAYLKREFNVLALEDLVRHLARNRLPPRSIALTFDDGYLDSLTAAAPVLEACGLPATFFVVTTMHERPREFWWDALERALGNDRELPARLELRISGRTLSLSTFTSSERRIARMRLTLEMYEMSQEETDKVVELLLRWSGEGKPSAKDPRTLSADEIRRLDVIPGMSVGSHTANHLLLPALTRDVKNREIIESKRSLEKLLDREVTSLCYPYGRADSETVVAARDAGYQYAVRTGNASATSRSDALAIPRIAVRAGDDISARLQAVFGEPRTANS